MPSSEKGQPYCDGGPSWQPTQKFTRITGTVATDIIAGTPPNGGKWILDDVVLSASADTVVTLQDTADTPNVLAEVDLAGGSAIQLTLRDGFRLAAVGKKLQAVSANAVTLRVTASAHEEVT